MRNNIVVPKQRVSKRFDTKHEVSVVTYIRLVKDYDLEQLGIELNPLSSKYWEYDPSSYYTKDFYLNYTFLGENPTPRHEDWIVLPEEAELIVKEDITIERMLDALRNDYNPWFVPNARLDVGFYHLPRLFKNVMTEEELKIELLRILDDPALLERSKTIFFPVFNEDTNEEIRFEVVLTPYRKWRFARIIAVEYNGARFEHYLKRPGDTNVYKMDSNDVELLKNSLIDFRILPSSDEWLAEQLICHFIDGPTPQVLINQEMGLRLQAKWVSYLPKVSEVSAKFSVLEMDYTTFME